MEDVTRAPKVPLVSRVDINTRLTLGFALIIVLMLVGVGILLWQAHVMRTQANRLKEMDEQFIEVLRVHDVLLSFRAKYGELARARDLARLQEEAPAIRTQLNQSLRNTQAVFSGVSPKNILDPTVLPTLRSIQGPLPSQVDSLIALASAGDWEAVQSREKQVDSIEGLSAQLVDTVHQEVANKRKEAASNIEQAQIRTLYLLPGVAGITLMVAAVLGIVITRSITRPLRALVEGASALARGDFDHQVPIAGRDELAQLGEIFNNTTVRLRDLYRELQSSEAYLAEGQRLAKTGSWAHNPNSDRAIYWSEEMRRIFGLAPQQSKVANTEEFLQLVHPDDRDKLRERLEKAIREKADFVQDYRIVLPDGTVKHIHGTGHPVLDEAGNIVEYVGTDMDVTEQHEASAALQKAFEQINAEQTELRRMMDAIATGVYVLRPDGTVLHANQTVLNYTGLTLEDLQREDLRAQVIHPDDVERLRGKRHEAFARGVPFEDEQRALGKDGKYRWFLVRYSPLRDDHGNIIRWYATGTDIEDRKQAEERMRDENLALREQIDQAFMFEEIVGSSPALQNVLSSVLKVAPTDSTVLITGETGTGKELIARAIHKHSQRSRQAFISVNCASIPSSLIASELFGHEKGAFTGAVQRREGRFELAHSGTIFLDEVGDLPAEAQVTLLRVLQERQFERVGGNRTLTTDVRVIAATNRDLTAAIAAGTFRSDLFYRLNVFPIEMPSLRERKEDIPLLVEYFIDRYARKAGKSIRGVNKKTLDLFQSYPWPGNIRELQNIIERSVIVCETETFSVDENWLTRQPVAREPKSQLDLSEKLALEEKEMIEAALRDCGGQVFGPSGAAARLGMPRSTLESKIRSLKINKNRFKAADHFRNA
jgi:PAS domain S-box-containing protein